ncbi:nbp35-like nucleotide binding protein [Tubulinosema ratisbonensis]|uniref:Nbp35-like nucleotide binding protein n=1 Tax=Tubulinosema ratisbonensis TaxID=291195 RepID=A0A437AMW3_9MICR|nr:nbp35-like nucleotide binding protein [Tubulinosema ratisbonensis]
MSKCPGMSSKEAGKSSACTGCPNQSTCSTKVEDPSIEIIKHKFANHKKIAIMSGKGGVGKSTVSKTFSQFLSKKHSVCLIDLDITGPSTPILVNSNSLGIINQISDQFYSFVPLFDFKETFLENDFELANVLIFDTPPNVTQSHLDIVKYLNLDGVIIVTQPHFLSFNDCKRMIDFCKKAKFRILGVIVNMDGFVCECGTINDSIEDGKYFCEQNNVKYLGSIKLKKEIAMKCDKGNDLEIEEYENIYKEIELIFE